MTRLSVIVPVLNEAAVLPAVLAHLRTLEPAPECIVVDGGSTDGTWDVLQPDTHVRALHARQGRATQLNAGAAIASGDWLLFLHADTHFSQACYDAWRAEAEAGAAAWGWFDVRFDEPRLAYRLYAWAVSRRARLWGSPTGDQAVFVRRELFDAAGGFPDVPLMEDVALARALRQCGRGRPVRVPVVTSARRWRRRGLLRTILSMWLLKLQYLAGRDPHTLARTYPHVR